MVIAGCCTVTVRYDFHADDPPPWRSGKETEMETKRKYTCCTTARWVAAWDRGCEFSADPANHYDVECPRQDCRFGRVGEFFGGFRFFDL